VEVAADANQQEVDAIAAAAADAAAMAAAEELGLPVVARATAVVVEEGKGEDAGG
jgi:hypothetical protein